MMKNCNVITPSIIATYGYNKRVAWIQYSFQAAVRPRRSIF